MLCLISVVVGIAADAIPPAGNSQSLPTLIWHGQSEIGYLRVELWSHARPGLPYTQDLIVKTTGEEGTVRYNGLMVQLPPDLKTEPKTTQMFVRSPADLDARPMREYAVLAILGPNGTLRLYSCGSRRFIQPCDLMPSGS